MITTPLVIKGLHDGKLFQAARSRTVTYFGNRDKNPKKFLLLAVDSH
ncbi:MAG: hypothetical protein KIG95_05800 [Comamonas sp.]|nr:hypothetical protein [Comamonas sp.]